MILPYGYELTVIIQDGMRRMYQDNESCYYYLTIMNEAYVQTSHARRRGAGYS